LSNHRYKKDDDGGNAEKYVDIVTRFFTGGELSPGDIKFMIAMIKDKSNKVKMFEKVLK
jgi:hypothetical protein